jgi:hypothetical protein
MLRVRQLAREAEAREAERQALEDQVAGLHLQLEASQRSQHSLLVRDAARRATVSGDSVSTALPLGCSRKDPQATARVNCWSSLNQCCDCERIKTAREHAHADVINRLIG